MSAHDVCISAAYVVMGVLLLAMGLTSRFAWWVKAAAIVVTSVFFVEAFFATKGLLGWPGTGPLPAGFNCCGRGRSSLMRRPETPARSFCGSRKWTRTTCRPACRAPTGCPIPSARRTVHQGATRS